MICTFPRTFIATAVVALAATSLIAAGSPATPTAPPAGLARAVVAVPASPLLRLPVGAPPRGFPYAIGKTIYLDGRRFNATARWGTIPRAGSEFSDVALTRGVLMWLVPHGGCGDPCARLGSYRPGGTFTSLTDLNAYAGLATTSGGLVSATSESSANMAPIYTTAGKLYGPPFTWASPSSVATVQGVGSRFVFQASPVYQPLIDMQSRSYRVYPGYGPVELPHRNTYGVGQGSGWLATAETRAGSCYRVAPLTAPGSLRARICSEMMPVVSNDGTKAVVVQGVHIRLYNTITGAQINATNAPTLGGMTKSGYYRPIQWETSTSYLVSARDGTTLTILRCHLNRACERAVTTTLRPGVTSIVTPLPAPCGFRHSPTGCRW